MKSKFVLILILILTSVSYSSQMKDDGKSSYDQHNRSWIDALFRMMGKPAKLKKQNTLQMTSAPKSNYERQKQRDIYRMIALYGR